VRVNERKEKINFKLSIIAGLASSIIFSWLGSQSLNGGAGAAVPGIVYYPVISLLLGFLLICSLAFCYDESTKMYGVFLVTFIIPLLLSCIILLNILFLDFVFYGIVAGMVVSGYFLVNHHHEIFSRYVKVLLTLFAAFLLFIVLYNFVLFILANGFVGAYENYKLDFISYIVNTVIVVALYWFVVRKIKGINGSQVFVFGPSRSGKTYFMLGMYKQFVDFFEGHPREVIFSGVPEEEKNFSSAHYLGQIEKNEPLRATVTDMVGIYTMRGKKWGFNTIDLTIVDYAGEWVHDLPAKIDPASFTAIVQRLSATLNIDQKSLSENIGFIKFILSIKENNRAIIPSIIEDVISSFIYKRLLNSGKIILLIDGDLIARNDGPSRDELTRLFGYYVKIMDFVGEEKQYALVVTKTDKIEPIETVAENSPRAQEIEESVFKTLRSITTFQAIENKAGTVPIYFFCVSVNSMNTDGQQVISQIFPWRFDEVAKFEF
jgi:hypothetical protein